MHWLLDVEFKDDLSRYRAGHAPKTWRPSAASHSTRRANKSKGSVKPDEKLRLDPKFLLEILQLK